MKWRINKDSTWVHEAMLYPSWMSLGDFCVNKGTWQYIWPAQLAIHSFIDFFFIYSLTLLIQPFIHGTSCMRCLLCARAHLRHKDVILFAEACAPKAEISTQEQHLTFWVGLCSEGFAGLWWLERMAGSCAEGWWLEKHQKRVESLEWRMLQRERWSWAWARSQLMSTFAYSRKIFGFLFHRQQECTNELKASSHQICMWEGSLWR